MIENDCEWQMPIREIPKKRWDVIVVGAGPAGSTAAAHLARRNLEVLLIEKEEFPRDKVCGDVLIADTIKCLKHLDLYQKVRSKGNRSEVVSAYSPSGYCVDVPGEFLTLQRESLDALIAEESVRSGAVCASGSVEEVSHSGDVEEVRIEESERIYRAKIVIVATGTDLSLLRKRGMVSQRQDSAVAIRRYLRSSYEIDRMIISLDESVLPGYAWIFPLSDNTYNIGCGLFFENKTTDTPNLPNMLDAFVSEFEPAEELVDEGEWLETVHGATLRCGLKGTQCIDDEGRLLAVGESIGTTFPFTGEGIGKAMETAEIAAEAVEVALESGSRSHLEEIPEHIDEYLKPRYRGYEIAQQWMTSPWFLDLVAWRGQSSTRVQEALAEVINEEIYLQEALSWKGFLRLALG
jgi:geranylgeranyl reductase family protein